MRLASYRPKTELPSSLIEVCQTQTGISSRIPPVDDRAIFYAIFDATFSLRYNGAYHKPSIFSPSYDSSGNKSVLAVTFGYCGPFLVTVYTWCGVVTKLVFKKVFGSASHDQEHTQH